ncbi:hypothetical protein AAP_00500 [Ascosphaera apis ARSEF 7405]|uniref:Uncharacterized protein n=1 Tax=Ascosphaera apis ARSEF 7405 TaxID=392613 RepID=A0A168DY80_9EURO|nr:hypothetical protein AAP_00500 [Ascosphaera apis ARSEF 7405]
MSSAKTISEHKAEFIRSQVRILSAPIEPAEDWKDYAWVPKKKKKRGDGEDGETHEDDGGDEQERDIPDKVIGDVLGKFNSHLKQHSRSVFSSQAIHHVSRQIGNLYWRQVEADVEKKGNALGKSCDIEKGADLAIESNILKLPERPWNDGYDEEIDDESREKYTQLLTQLKTLPQTLHSLQTKLDQQKKLESLLKPFEDPSNNIQPNLVTRDGELSEEIEKMRMLTAKVVLKLEKEKREGKIRLNAQGDGHGIDHGDRTGNASADASYEEVSKRKKLDVILGMP